MAEFSTGISKLLPAYELVDNKPIPKRSVVSFVDVLGYKNKVRSAAEDKDSDQFLADYRQALFCASEYILDESPKYAYNFTDAVVVGWPISDDAENALCISCWELAKYQLTMSLFGFFLRGGVAIGDAYFDSYVQAGEAYIDAYEIESNLAINPRIVLSESAVKEAQAICKSYSSHTDCPLNRLFCVDADSLVFINYLGAVFDIFDFDTDRMDIENHILIHKEMIERNLDSFRNDIRIYRKYQWAARYHDDFCCRLGDYLEKDLTIGVLYEKERFSPPKPLLEVFPQWVV